MATGRGSEFHDLYSGILRQLMAQEGNKPALGMKVLMWVLYSERPLLAEELCHALGVEIGSAELDFENIPPLQMLLECCLDLVTIEESSSTLQLMHFTLREYLLSDPTLLQIPESTIAEVCLTYLNFRSLWDLSPTSHSATPAMPLQEYASCYWEKHARRGMTENVKALALRLLDRRAMQLGLRLLG